MVPAVPTAVVTENAQTESMIDTCPSGYTGSQEYWRTATHRATQFPWDGSPIVQINYGPWILETDNCEAVIPPDLDVDVGGETGGVGGDGDPGDDSCDTNSNPDDPGSGRLQRRQQYRVRHRHRRAWVVPENQDTGDGGACFLTTANCRGGAVSKRTAGRP